MKEKTQSNIRLLELLVCINLLGIDLFYPITFSFIRVFITQVTSVLLNMTFQVIYILKKVVFQIFLISSSFIATSSFKKAQIKSNSCEMRFYFVLKTNDIY